MRALGFDAVRVQWLGAPGLKIHEDLVATRRAVRWQTLQPSRRRIPNGFGGSISVRQPARNGELFLEVVDGSRTHLLFKQIEQLSDLISNLPAPFYVRDTRTTELIVFMNASLRGVPPGAKGTAPNVATWILDYDRAIETLADINGAQV